MTSITLKAFRGKIPRTSARLLQPNYAVEALNCKLTAGRLDPVRGPVLVHTSAAESVQTIYRYRHNAQDNWLVWGDSVDVVRSPTAQDSLGRLYFTGQGEPRMTSFADAIDGEGPYPAAWYVLGVHAPTVAPTLTHNGGAAANVTRSYVYTFRTRYNEESGPSPATIYSAPSDATYIRLYNMEAPPPNAGTISAAVTVATGIVELTVNTSRGLSAHEQIAVSGVTGMTSLNGTRTITSVESATKIRVALDTEQVYAAGGAWAREAPHNTSGMKRCIYRVEGTSTEYRLVAEIDATIDTYDDAVPGTSLGRALPSLNSFPPPKNGHSVRALANGSLAMLAGNELCLSEQYKPYSWPIANRYAFAGQGVTLGVAGNSVIVLTDTYPVEAIASVPESASLSRLPVYAPCVAKLGAADIGGAIAYPSHDGLYVVGPGVARNITDELYRHDEWQALKPETFRAAYYDQRYYAVHAVEGRPDQTLVMDMAEPDGVTELTYGADAMLANALDGKLYVAKDRAIYQWDGDDSARMIGFWQSMEFQLGQPQNFSCAQVFADYDEIVTPDTSAQAGNDALLAQGADAIDGALGATPLGAVSLGATALVEVSQGSANRVQFSLAKNGVVVFSRELSSSKPFRLPAGIKSEVYSVLITSSVPVYGVYVAQSMAELARIST